jgi:hypothetical protein
MSGAYEVASKNYYAVDKSKKQQLTAAISIRTTSMLLSTLLFISANLFGHTLVCSFDQNDQQKQNKILLQQRDHVIGQGVADYIRVSDGRNFPNRRRLSTEQMSSGISNVNSTLPLLPVAFLPSTHANLF